MKKLLALILAAVMLLSLAACAAKPSDAANDAENPSAGTPANNEETPKDNTADTPADESSDDVVIELFNQKVEIVDILNGLIAEYEASHPGVKIELVTPADSSTVLTTRMASDDAPDVFTDWPNAAFFEKVDAGHVMDLSDTGIMENVQEAARAQWKHNGGEYAATISYNCSGIWYNMDMLAEVGVTELPSTWAELMDLCEKLKEAGKTPFIASGKEVSITDRYLQVFLASCIGDTYAEFDTDADPGNLDVTKSYGQPLVAMGEKMLQVVANAQDDVLGCDQDNATANFARGDGAMMIGGSWLLASVTAANPNINIAMGPIPGDTAEETRTCAYPGDMTLCISSTTKVKDAAVEFVKWFTSPEIAAKYAEAEGNPSCINGVDYVAPQFADLYADYVTAGRFVLNPDCTWSAAQQNASGAAIQQLYYDGDAAALPELLADAFNNN